MKSNHGESAGWVVKLSALILGIAMLLVGGGLAVLGAYLAYLGGSFYFVLMGIATLCAGGLIACQKKIGIKLFGMAIVLSVIWAVADAGLEFWPLVSRLMMFAVMGILVAVLYPFLASSKGHGREKGIGFSAAFILLVGVVATFIAMFYRHDVINTPSVAQENVTQSDIPEQTDWKDWGHTPAGDRYSPLNKINKDNVRQLKVAWTYRSGDIAESNGSGAEDQNTPLQVGNTLYYCTPYSKVIALDADKGTSLWKFDPHAQAPNWQRCRGLGFYEDKLETQAANTTVSGGGTGSFEGMCRRRVFLPTVDARLIALDADSGQLCDDFGNHGTVDLKQGMGEVKSGWYAQTSTPLIAGNLVVVGGRVADNFSVDEPSGAVRAFDVHSGKLVWAWDSGNSEITGMPTKGETYTRGSPNVWSAMSYDPKLNLIYLPTGNTTPDFYGTHRTPEEEKYSSSIVALDAGTGRVRWHFQTTHHDLWDFDLPAQPLLVDVPDADGQKQPALVQVSKQGQIYMLNRATGKPIAKIEEREVPQGNLPGERYSTTQPYSTGMPMMGNSPLKESDMWGITPFDQALCRIEFKKMRSQGPYTPPGLDRALQYPGSLGGMNWGSVSIDPTNNLMFVNDMRLGLANYMVPRAQIPESASGIEMGIVPQTGTPYGAMRERFVSPLGIPCQKPPFGTLSAIDLTSHQLKWQVPVGTVEDTGPFGIAMHLPLPVGMPTLGPTLATGSGLVFFAGSQDFYLRAFDANNGKELAKWRLPVGSQGGPMTYVSPSTGKQYIVVSAGGARQATKRGDYLVAYTLPD